MKSEKKVIVSIIISIVLIIVVISSGITINSLNKSKEEATSDIVTTYNVSTTESTTVEITTETTTKSKLSNNYKVLATGSEDNGDVYELVGEQKETVNNGGIKIGVIKNNEWLVEMTSDNPFISENGYLLVDNEEFNIDREYRNTGVFFEYCGNGVFLDYSYYRDGGIQGIRGSEYTYVYGVVYNFESEKYYRIDSKAGSFLGLKYEDDNSDMRYWDSNFKFNGKLVYRDKDVETTLKILDFKTLDIKEVDCKKIGLESFSQYSEGLMFVECNNQEKSWGFVDENLNLVIDLTSYRILNRHECDDRLEWHFDDCFFSAGKCTFKARSKSDTKFRVTIDKTGKEISSVGIE